jgi:endonuclease/exonuclease/phosphatase family metal-dependent hydrolase
MSQRVGVAVLLFGVTIGPSFAQVPAPAFQSSTAKIAAWNLQGFTPITQARVQEQVEALKILDADVVALVEVNPLVTMGRLTTQLNSSGLCYQSSILDQTATLDMGVLFKCGVTASNPRFIAGSDLGVASARNAFVVDMRVGRFDFVMIVVHLKSGRGAAEQATRDQQAAVIATFIAQLRAAHPQRDILVLGDFNMIPGQDVSNFHVLGGSDTLDFLSSWDMQESFSHILPAGPANLLDGFAITRTFTTEYVRGSLRVFPMHWAMDMGLERFRDTISDHLPFVATFRID